MSCPDVQGLFALIVFSLPCDRLCTESLLRVSAGWSVVWNCGIVLCPGQTHLFFVLFDLILYVPSTIFKLNRDGSSCVETVLS